MLGIHHRGHLLVSLAFIVCLVRAYKNLLLLEHRTNALCVLFFSELSDPP
jgi:hypothetical protein